jgi:F0F1-type ATP synthase membrane subunit a
MRLSPDEIIFWQLGFFKLNATIVYTWGLMIVLALGSKLVTSRLSKDLQRSRWQNLLEIVVTGIAKQIEEVGISQPQKYLGFLGTLFLFVGMACSPSFPATSRQPVRSRPRRRWRSVCSWLCRCSASRRAEWENILEPT